jgi:ssDNA-binding Zn-finger/Zn-ribbon topoisomerase 1
MAKRKFEVWCHTCGCLMSLRTGKFGKFYGCTAYPTCRNTLNLRDAMLQDDGPVHDIDLGYDDPSNDNKTFTKE